MYKSRLKAWGYRKNIRLRHGEDKSLIPLLHDTVQHPEQSETASRAVRLRNGQIVSHDRLVKHLRRRGEGRASTNTKMTVRAIKSPDVLYVSEAVLFQVRTYIHGPWQESVSTAERLDLLRDECAANEEWNSIAHGVRRALDERKLNEALVLMRRAPDVLANLIERRPANMLQVLFMSLSYFTSGGRLERTEATQLSVVVKCLVKYAAAFTSNDQGLPRSHPIHQMFYMLANADEQDIHPLATKAWLTNCQLWDGVMDRPRSTCAVASWISYGEFNGFDAMPSNLGNIIKFMVDYNAAKLGEHQWVSPSALPQHKVLCGLSRRYCCCLQSPPVPQCACSVLWDLTLMLERPLTTGASRRTIHLSQIYTTYLTCREKANGKDPFFNDDVVRSFGALLRRGPQGPMRIDALGWLARACRARRDRDSAEAYMRELIDLMLKDSTHRDTSTRDLINDLEMWFIEWGETEKAAGLARWRDEELGAEATA